MTTKKVTLKSFPILKGILIFLYLGTSIIVFPFFLAMLTITLEAPGSQIGAIIFYIALLGLYLWGFAKLLDANFDKRRYEKQLKLRICFKIKSEVELQQVLDWIDAQFANTEVRSIKFKVISQKSFGGFYIVDSNLDLYSKSNLNEVELKELFQNYPDFILELAFI